MRGLDPRICHWRAVAGQMAGSSPGHDESGHDESGHDESGHDESGHDE
jgi:hypothetical protein